MCLSTAVSIENSGRGGGEGVEVWVDYPGEGDAAYRGTPVPLIRDYPPSLGPR